MERPYIICHMVASIDGRVTGDFLSHKKCERATEIYYDINRSTKSNGFICGRITMETSFTNGWYPVLDAFEDTACRSDFVPSDLSGFYAVAFDTNGSLGWQDSVIHDWDEGYDKAQIIEVLSESVDGRYLSYLKSKGIGYIFAGTEKIDVRTALCKLKSLFGAEILLLEGGSVINGAFQNADLIDELSLVTAPLTASADGKPLFWNGSIADFDLISIESNDGTSVVRYKRKSI